MATKLSGLWKEGAVVWLSAVIGGMALWMLVNGRPKNGRPFSFSLNPNPNWKEIFKECLLRTCTRTPLVSVGLTSTCTAT